MNKLDWFIAIVKVFSWIMLIAVIYMLILKITGHSPAYETITLSALGIIGSLVVALVGLGFRMYKDIGGLKSDVRHIEKRLDMMEQGFDRRFEAINRRFERIELKLDKLINVVQ